MPGRKITDATDVQNFSGPTRTVWTPAVKPVLRSRSDTDSPRRRSITVTDQPDRDRIPIATAVTPADSRG